MKIRIALSVLGALLTACLGTPPSRSQSIIDSYNQQRESYSQAVAKCKALENQWNFSNDRVDPTRFKVVNGKMYRWVVNSADGTDCEWILYKNLNEETREEGIHNKIKFFTIEVLDYYIDEKRSVKREFICEYQKYIPTGDISKGCSYWRRQ